MSGFYAQIHVLLDPEQSDPLPGGGRLQDVSIVFSDHADLHPPAQVAVLPFTARRVALELLAAADTADLMMQEAS